MRILLIIGLLVMLLLPVVPLPNRNYTVAAHVTLNLQAYDYHATQPGGGFFSSTKPVRVVLTDINSPLAALESTIARRDSSWTSPKLYPLPHNGNVTPLALFRIAGQISNKSMSPVTSPIEKVDDLYIHNASVALLFDGLAPGKYDLTITLYVLGWGDNNSTWEVAPIQPWKCVLLLR